jgi:hypothetical protein
LSTPLTSKICHPACPERSRRDRSGPIFSSAPNCSASGRGVEGSLRHRRPHPCRFALCKGGSRGSFFRGSEIHLGSPFSRMASLPSPMPNSSQEQILPKSVIPSPPWRARDLLFSARGGATFAPRAINIFLNIWNSPSIPTTINQTSLSPATLSRFFLASVLHWL